MFTRKSKFCEWLDGYKDRYGKGVNIQDIDIIIHDYNEGWYITIEEKTQMRTRTWSQLTFQNIFTQILKSANDKVIDLGGGKSAKLEYRGHYVIVFENTTPDDSGFVIINGVKYGWRDIQKVMKKLLTTGSIEDW